MAHYSKPKVFLGSSVEGLPIAHAIMQNLEHDVHCRIWQHAFPLSHHTIDSLLAELRINDFAIFILSPDDVAKMRGKEFITSRDNLLFEAGLAIGKYGKLRCMFAIPRDIPEFHIPTDLLGITMATYDQARILDDALNATVVCSNQLRHAIQISEWNSIKLEATARIDTADQAELKFKNKVFLTFVNKENYSIQIELKEAELKHFKIDPESQGYGNTNKYLPPFIEKKGGVEFYRQIHTLRAMGK